MAAKVVLVWLSPNPILRRSATYMATLASGVGRRVARPAPPKEISEESPVSHVVHNCARGIRRQDALTHCSVKLRGRRLLGTRSGTLRVCGASPAIPGGGKACH